MSSAERPVTAAEATLALNRPATSQVARPYFPAVLLIALSAICYVAALTFGTFDLSAFEEVGIFYDYQANSLLHGHWDVPDQAIHDEAFVVGGRSYGYFGPTPAWLRMPLIAAGVPYGHLTKTFMLLDFVGGLLAAYLILRDATRLLRSGAEPSAWGTIVFLGCAGLGSTLFFLGARPMMYHEAIACGAAFALWSVWCSLRFIRRPSSAWWTGALICGILSIQARATTGFFALSLLGLAALRQFLFAYGSSGEVRPTAAGSPRARALVIGFLCIAGALSLNGIAYAKFHTFDSAPYQFSRPYMTSADRYGHVDHKKFHAENIPWGFYAYFAIENFRFEPHFPYFVMAGRNSAAAFPNAKIDLPDFTVPAPYSMPGLLTLGTVGALVAFAIDRNARRPLTLLWIAGIPMAVLLCGFIATAQRYLADFCPLLIGSAAFGVAAIDCREGLRWRMVRTGLVGVTLIGILASAAVVFDHQANWGAGMPEPIKARYQQAGHRIDDWVSSLRGRG